ncbi:MAG: hypothetical protein WAT66_06060, partial [Actinomycetota bacterium]
MKIRLAVVSCVTLSLLGFMGVLPAGADRPTREFSPAEDSTIPSEFACGTGDVQIHIDQNNEYATTRTDRDGVERTHVSGVLKSTWTNVATGKSVSLNVSGPGTLTFDGDTLDLVGSGNWVNYWFDNLPNQILYTSGSFHAVVD